MNAIQHYAPTHGYIDAHQPHLGHEGSHLTATSYPGYHAPMMSTVQGSYAPTQPTASYYTYANPPVASHPTQYGQHSLPSIPSLASMAQAPAPPTSSEVIQSGSQTDPTGQTGPLNKRPKITATLWEDENTLCFQVEANGICVARRADNCYVNGTKLLNVANMTRGRRDGLLKGEKSRKVVKIGPMHLKGVWIPFDRALDYANKEKIADSLYPLFVNNVEQFLTQNNWHAPQIVGQRGTTSRDFGHTRNSSTMSQAPSMHSASNSISLSRPASSHHVQNRPSIDRAQTLPTLPTPPTTASSNAPPTGGSYDWANAAAHHVDHGTGLSNAKSMPSSPVTTPPENTVQQLQYTTTQPTYDARMYQMQPPYTLAPVQHGYGKTEMLPPPSRKLELNVVKDEGENIRPDSGYTVNGSEPYETRPYTYQHPGTTSNAVQPANVQTIEPQKRSTSPGDNTPRPATAGSTPQANHWQQRAYTTPQRISTDYRPMSAGSGMHSASHSYSNSATPQAYYGYANGGTPTYASSTNKRLRDIDEEDEDGYARPASHGGEYDGGLKRRKTVRETTENVVRPIATPSALSRSRSMNHQRR